jgi:arginine deiminase
MKKNNLTNYLNKDKYVLQPLHNFFYTRDSAFSFKNNIFINRMASKVRDRESLIMNTIFNFHPNFEVKTINPLTSKHYHKDLTIEGGDVLIIKDNVIVIGNGVRTSSYGFDYILRTLKERKEKVYLISQELPRKPESFIHLDMVFTMLDCDLCMIYEPVIMSNKFLTVVFEVDNGKVTKVREQNNLLEALKTVGVDLKPILCGGDNSYSQEREQWHSGANFFSIGPGKVIGYKRNTATIEQLVKEDFDVIDAKNIKAIDIFAYDKCVVTISGSELSRGGGGCRCMTMPIRRKDVIW